MEQVQVEVRVRKNFLVMTGVRCETVEVLLRFETVEVLVRFGTGEVVVR